MHDQTTRESPSESNAPIVLITGSTGLIGSRVCRQLRSDYRIVGLDRDPPRTDPPERWIHCDLTDDDSVSGAIDEVARRYGSRLASVIHLAAYYDFSGAPSPLYQDLTVEGTRRLVRALLGGFEVEQFVFSSSLLVMQPSHDGAPLDEGSPTEAEWDYPRSKLETEALIRRERDGIPTVVLRIAGVYDEEGHSPPLTQQMRRIYERKLESYVFPGDPEHGQSFVHLDDLAACFQRVVHRRAELAREEVFLIGEPDVVSYDEIQDLLGRALHGEEWTTVRIPAAAAKAGAWLKEKVPGSSPFIRPWMVDLADAHMPVDISHAVEELGWEPRRRLRRTLPLMARRLLDDPRGWYETNGIEPPDDLRDLAAGGSGQSS